MNRIILHSDMNACYASIEQLYHPELRNRPLAVGGDPESRHGIVLAKSQMAKKAGVQTGMALWQARQVCPDIVFVPPRMDLYLRFSRLAHEIYAEYTDLQEPFGIDECWLDCTDSASIKGDGEKIAQEIRSRVKDELGVTVSIGVSWNKIFAKLGSDYKKPDAVTVISRENYRQIVWPLPASDLLYVGKSTERKLYSCGIRTIGDLANADPQLLQHLLGKMGLILSLFANGQDETPVSLEHAAVPVKSVGNSMTTPRDLVTDEDVRIVVYMLSESVASRLRDNGFVSNVIEVNLRDNGLTSFTRQHKQKAATNISTEIALAAMNLFYANYDLAYMNPLRSIGVRACDLISDESPIQLDLFTDQIRRDRLLKADKTVDDIRRRFGYSSIKRGIMMKDNIMTADNAKEHIVHPHSYMERGNQTGTDM